ncbi:MAG TPA: hypothetical protein VLK89_02620 [Solirubrobacterales bacterium]|nr:hypothetical protein [Solirubrobacterales bacterium]
MKKLVTIGMCSVALFACVIVGGCGSDSKPPVTNSAGTPTARSADITGESAEAVEATFESSPDDLQKNCELMSRSGRYILEAEWIKNLSSDDLSQAKREEIATAAAAYLEEHC